MGLISGALGLLKLTGLDTKIGQLFGGDTGEAVAKKVVDIAQMVTGTTNMVDAAAQLELSPELALNFEEALMAQEVELVKLAHEDRKGARNLQVAALTQKDTFSKRFVYYFAIGWSSFAMLYISLITFLDIPEGNERFADTMLGFLLGTALAGVFQFFYGSSEGNERRSETDQHVSLASKINT